MVAVYPEPIAKDRYHLGHHMESRTTQWPMRCQ